MEQGERLRVTCDIDLDMHGIVHAGETGTVTKVDKRSGEVWITLDKFHRGLADFDNAIWLVPPYTDEEIGARLVIIHEAGGETTQLTCDAGSALIAWRLRHGSLMSLYRWPRSAPCCL